MINCLWIIELLLNHNIQFHVIYLKLFICMYIIRITGWWRTRGPTTGVMMAMCWCPGRRTTVVLPQLQPLSHLTCPGRLLGPKLYRCHHMPLLPCWLVLILPPYLNMLAFFNLAAIFDHVGLFYIYHHHIWLLWLNNVYYVTCFHISLTFTLKKITKIKLFFYL